MPDLIRRFLALVLMVLLFPVWIVVILAVLVFGGGSPIIFKHLRVGKGQKQFVLFKFRTMYPGADLDKEKYRHLSTADGPVFKIEKDPRFTDIGAFLSHTGLDELPQLINIIRGEMNFIGPRPLPVNEVEKIKGKYLVRHEVKPGIISPWLFIGYHQISFDQWMRSDLRYVQNKTFFYDLKLFGQSIILVSRLIVQEILDKGKKKVL